MDNGGTGVSELSSLLLNNLGGTINVSQIEGILPVSKGGTGSSSPNFLTSSTGLLKIPSWVETYRNSSYLTFNSIFKWGIFRDKEAKTSSTSSATVGFFFTLSTTPGSNNVMRLTITGG